MVVKYILMACGSRRAVSTVVFGRKSKTAEAAAAKDAIF